MPPPLENFNTDDDHKYQFPLSYNGLQDAEQNHFDPNVSMQSAKSSASQQQTPKSVAKTGRAPVNKGIDTLAGLAALPILRPIPWKENRQLTPEQMAKQSTRVQTRGAFLLSQRGTVRNPPCDRCLSNTGRFSACISNENWFRGACATCEMATRGNLCSLRIELEERKGIGKAAVPKPNLEELESPVSDHAEIVSLKRKRTSDAPQSTPTSNPYISSYHPDQPWNQGHAQTYTQVGTNYTVQPQNAVVEARQPLLDYIFQKQNPPNGAKRHHPIQRAQRDSQEPANKSSGLKNGYSVNAYTGARVGSSSEDRADDKPAPLSPSIQLQHTSWQNYKTGPTVLESRLKETVDLSLIDTLSRKKQKQIFSIIGGIQSGIRNVRQQTEDLQKQLDLLQESLGIGVDDDDDEL